jgi:hypothetical protein
VILNFTEWTIYIKDLNTGVVDTVNHSTSGATTLFHYYNILTKTWDANHEPNKNSWDFYFTNYGDLYHANPGPPTPTWSVVTGVLQNYNVVTAQVNGIAPDSADYTTIDSAAYSMGINTIGWDWKAVNGAPPPTYLLDSTVSWFVKKIDSGDIWQLYFDYFQKDSTTGDQMIGLQKRLVYHDSIPNSVNQVSQYLNNFILAPNPVVDGNVNLLVDAKQNLTAAQISITDITGRTIMKTTKNISTGFHQLRLNVGNYPTGIYLVNLSGNGYRSTQKLVIQR